MMDRQFLGRHILGLKYWFVGDVTILVDYDPTVGWLKHVETFIQVPSVAGQAAINVSHDSIYSLLVIPFLLIISPLIHIKPYQSIPLALL